MRIIFMGTPGFAVGCLKALAESSHEVAAVVTAPDKPAGRGKKLRASGVKEFALQKNIPVLQPTNLKDQEFQKQLAAFEAQLFVVVAFRMLPEAVWSMPPKGTINLHASLLPDYRGAAPINWAIIHGESKSGVTTFFINENIDTGAIIFQEEVAINENDIAGQLHDKLMDAGASLLVKTVSAIELDQAPQQLQDLSKPAKTAPKIFRDDLKIDFNQPARYVYNRIRGLSPYPAAFAQLKNGEEALMLKFYRVELLENASASRPGTLHSDGKTYLEISCRQGRIKLLEGQLAGKKRMSVKELLNGLTLKDNAHLL